ncbi:OLC1v1026032C3 [Oldenlandia corymbosa var. corymbosa]|uniref:Vacuolar membrane protease n=1 Tax=Oldenlandia corymbosa var. corymbosa TaxID=529605 RepID=A0AAV1C6Z0_OLDCO|nr:OLC1v1026032C3 [Oldenlandia corymbosa var. corymbosa]
MSLKLETMLSSSHLMLIQYLQGKLSFVWLGETNFFFFSGNSFIFNQSIGLCKSCRSVCVNLDFRLIWTLFLSHYVFGHYRLVFKIREGAGDCSSCVSVMLELARGVSQWAHGFKHAVIFLFNTGEEEGLDGAHSFITQHPWSDTVRIAVDLEAMGIGGKSGIFQAGPHPWAIENFAAAAKYPSAQIVAQDLFSSGAIKSATDFQVYKEVGGLSGLDFAFADNTAVYHTKNDKLKLLKPGALQHLGENMLAFLLRAAASSDFPKSKAIEQDGTPTGDAAVYFDVLGAYMITFRQRLANMFYNSTIMQSLLIWVTSLMMGGSPAVIALALSCLSIVLMWICSIGFAALVALSLPLVSSSPVPYISTPWLVVGLFGGPAILGAFAGQHLGYIILSKYLSTTYSQRYRNLSSSVKADIAKLDSERWLFKSGLIQWLLLLTLGNYYKVGSTYIALVWLVSPAFAYGLLEATLSPARLPKPLKTLTLLVGLSMPVLLSAGMIIRLTATMIGTAVRFERIPGSNPEWLGSVIIAVLVAGFVCLTLVYLLSYIHISGAKVPIAVTAVVLLVLSIGAVSFGLIPAFTDDTARAVNVVHVVDTTGRYGGNEEADSYTSLFSLTPGNLIKEAEAIGNGMVCGSQKQPDFVTFSVKYGCWIDKDAGIGWDKSDIPSIHVEHDRKDENRITEVSLDTKVSTRWTLAINMEEIEDFLLKDAEGSELIPVGGKSSADGWHIIQFSGGKKAPTKFDLKLFWTNKNVTSKEAGAGELPLLKLRTDVDRLTPPAQDVLGRLPSWCSLFGKSTSPHTLAFLSSLPVGF